MSQSLPIGIVADNPNFPGEWQNVVAKVKLADELGFHSVWLGETWGYEIFTSLADLMHATSQIGLGVGIANVFSRSPGVIATSVATLDERSGGRILLGLGSSGPQVIEHWHGVPYEKPLQRIREYTEIINMVMRREPLHYHGQLYNLDRGFKLRFKPVRDHIPIYIAALTPRSIQQTGQIADGILPTFWPLSALATMRAELDAGAVEAGRPTGSCHIAPYLTTALIASEDQRQMARMLARGPIAWYIGRMGTFYADMLRRTGYPYEVESVLAGWQTGQEAAALAVSDALLDDTAIVGTPAEVAAGLHRWIAAGAAHPLIAMPPGDPESAGKLLSALKDAFLAA